MSIIDTCTMRNVRMKSARVSIVSFFFFDQKTAYEMLRSLVGSEMCIRDRAYIDIALDPAPFTNSTWGVRS